MDGRSKRGRTQAERAWDGPEESVKDRTGSGMLLGFGFVVLVLVAIWAAETWLR